MFKLFSCSVLLWFPLAVAALEVSITRDTDAIVVMHGDKEITVMRNQDTEAMLAPDFARTSRPCPPFCAQPMQADARVETIGEVELIEFMRTRLKDGSGVLIDARTPDWFQRGTIPGSVNIPFNRLNPAQGADELTLEDSLAVLGVAAAGSGWDFSGAKELVLWCNGPWCGQSPTAIRGLLSIGYPPDKIAYYRGGMQVWLVFGLPVVYPDGRIREE
ncbi:MAG: rhodanese-like domain-containing protein [Gammaproteobacteria bacterium]|nr:rhodanese-like domain-containing protein [Gammaproteobacteria bacterium]